MTANHDDLNRALGNVEGEVKGISAQMTEMKMMLQDIAIRLGAIEKLEAERKGAQRLAVWLAGMLGALLSWVGTIMLKFV